MKHLLALLTLICACNGLISSIDASQAAHHAQELSRVSASSASGAALSAVLTAMLLGGAYVAYTYPELYQRTSTIKPKPLEPKPAAVAAAHPTEATSKLNDELLLAAQLNKYDDVKKALDAGADVNARSKNGLTALMYNVLTANTKIKGEEITKIIRLLIQRGADVNAQDNLGTTALMYAAQRTFPLTTEEPDPLVRTLVDAGADINMTDNEGRTALEYLPETVTKLFTAERKRFLRQERVNQLMQTEPRQ